MSYKTISLRAKMVFNLLLSLVKTFKHLNHPKWREGRGFAERRSFVLRKRKEKRERKMGLFDFLYLSKPFQVEFDELKHF